MRNWVAVFVVAALVAVLAAVTTAQDAEKKDNALDESDGISLKGELSKQGDRPAFKVTDGEHKGKTFILLENSKLEELEKWAKDNKPGAVEVLCAVTKYNGKNFLVVSSFTKPGAEEEEEEEGDDDDEEEGDDEDDE